MQQQPGKYKTGRIPTTDTFQKVLGLVGFDPPILNPTGHLTQPLMEGGTKIVFQSQPHFLDKIF